MRAWMTAALAGGQLLCFVCSAGVRIQPAFQKGEKFTLEVKKSRGIGGVGGATVTPVTVEVLEAGERGTVLNWVAGETRFVDPALASHPLVAAVVQVITGMHFEIGLDENGQYAGLRNDKQLVMMLAGVRESMMERFMPLVAEAHRLQLRAYLHQALSPSGITAAATREAQLWFAVSGYEIDENQPLHLEKDTLGPYGAGTIPSKLAIRVVRANPEAQEAVVSYRQEFDTSALPDMVLGLAPGLRSKEDTRVEMYDDAQYVVDLGSRRVKAMTHVRTIEVEGNRRGDTTEIRLVE